MNEKLTISVTETAELLGIGRSAAYEGVRTGAIPSIRIGRRLLIPLKGLRELLEVEIKQEAPEGDTPRQYM